MEFGQMEFAATKTQNVPADVRMQVCVGRLGVVVVVNLFAQSQ